MSVVVFQNQPAIHIVTVNLTQSTEEIWAISGAICPPGQFLERSCHSAPDDPIARSSRTLLWEGNSHRGYPMGEVAVGECLKGRNWTGVQWDPYLPAGNMRVLANCKENVTKRRTQGRGPACQGLRVALGSLLCPTPHHRDWRHRRDQTRRSHRAGMPKKLGPA